MFAVGMNVVCIDAQPKIGDVGAIIPVHHLLEEGRVYRIKAIHWPFRAQNMLTGQWVPNLAGGRSLDLEGIELPPPMKGFSSYRFRRVVASECEFHDPQRESVEA